MSARGKRNWGGERAAAGGTIVWHDCGGDQCGMLQAPLDYSSPSAAQINLAIIRIAAEEPSERVGVLFFADGGPGGGSHLGGASGIDARFSQDVRDRYDLIGFDPRRDSSTGSTTSSPIAPRIRPVASGAPTVTCTERTMRSSRGWTPDH